MPKIDVDRCRAAMDCLRIEGPVRSLTLSRDGITIEHSVRMKAIEDAIASIQHNPHIALKNEYIGVKNYAGFGDQREDHRYGEGPRHGSIVFRITRTQKAWRTADPPPLTEDHIYLLECARDFLPATQYSHSELPERSSKMGIGLCETIDLYDRAQAALSHYENLLRETEVNLHQE